MQKLRQMEFQWPLGHGGAREGAGRKREGPRCRVTHKGRASFHQVRVLHITCRIADGLPSLRDQATAARVMEYFSRSSIKKGFRIVEYSIQGNHIHLICEAADNAALASAMMGILSGLARTLNRHWGRRGQVFEDRYHFEIIETPTQCRNALRYVLRNAKKHGARGRRSGADPYSTAPWFRFSSCPSKRTDKKPAANPHTWLLREGWRKKGSIHLHDRPCTPTRKRQTNR